MKSRVLITVLVVALAAAAIGGATLAWFTDSATSEDVTFAAGTLLINVDNEPVVTAMEDRSIDKVNPGDCATVCWNIVNEGTKSAELRAKIDAGWVDLGFEEENQVAFFAPVPDSGWVMYEENGETWLYYTGGPVAGTYGNEEGDSAETVSLCLVVGFDGPLMGNDYQDESYEISGIVEAVQSTNGAPEAQWGDAWTTATGEDYDNSGIAMMGYFLEGNGASMNCWTGVIDPPNYNVTVEASPSEGGTVTGDGTYAENDPVTVTAVAENGYTFTGWTGDLSSTNSSFEFNMPANDVTLTANFVKDLSPKYKLTLKVHPNCPSASGTVSGGGEYEAGTSVPVSATAKSGYKFVNWKEGNKVVSTYASFNYTMPSKNVQLTAYFEPKKPPHPHR